MFCSPNIPGNRTHEIKLPSFTELVTSIEECSSCPSPNSAGSSISSPFNTSEHDIAMERGVVDYHSQLPRIIRNDNAASTLLPAMTPSMASIPPSQLPTGGYTQLPVLTPTLPLMSPGSTTSSVSSSSSALTMNQPHPTYPHYTDSRLPTPPVSVKELLDPKRKHVCKVCTRCFTTSGHLARHNRIHTGERKHVCPWPTCSARFARQDNCMQHYKTHTNTKNKRSKLNFKRNSFSSKYYQATPVGY